MMYCPLFCHPLQQHKTHISTSHINSESSTVLMAWWRCENNFCVFSWQHQLGHHHHHHCEVCWQKKKKKKTVKTSYTKFFRRNLTHSKRSRINHTILTILEPMECPTSSLVLSQSHQPKTPNPLYAWLAPWNERQMKIGILFVLSHSSLSSSKSSVPAPYPSHESCWIEQRWKGTLDSRKIYD